MKKQSEAEWLASQFSNPPRAFDLYAMHPTLAKHQARRLITALKRRGWRAPVKQRTKKGR